MKKLLSLLLALSLVLTLMAGCGSSKKETKGTNLETDQKNSSALTQNTDIKSNSYQDAKKAEEAEKAEKAEEAEEAEMEEAIGQYLAETSYFKFDEKAVSDLVAGLSADIQIHETQISKFINALYQAIINCEIQQKTKNPDGSYTVVANVKTADLSKLDIEAAMKKMSEIITVDSVTTKLNITDEMSEKEIYDILFPAMLEEMTKSAKDFLIESDGETIPKNFTLKQNEGKWIVNPVS